ncbi:nuclear transport factor 2 family protein [Cellulomonas cellasea]|uniref:SnoaL-like domain-containing protein n=1 Tax=Cellulomonas cellasea TaxID=43670 RepID=A0A7W4UGM8_9CELL|nr:nuclear transport factor 2 family protein [Cellulomonas cellasea]MBB2923285.1 hypothetical protein [Cellulomonas cellasea]
MTTATRIPPTELPATIRAYLAAREAHDTEGALRALAPTAVVVDAGTAYRGTDEVRRFLTHAGSGFRWTSELVGAQREDDARWVVTHRLEGDFPGGVVELRSRFALDGGLVTELVIAP